MLKHRDRRATGSLQSNTLMGARAEVASVWSQPALDRRRQIDFARPGAERRHRMRLDVEAAVGAWGALIMSFFGAVFAALTLYWQRHVSGAALVIPFIAFALIGLAAMYVIRLPGRGIEPSDRAARAIMWSSIGEGIGLFLASNIVINLHRPDLLLPAMALVVGLHFLPIGFAASFRAFYVVGATLILFAIVGFAVRAPEGGEIAGFMAATGLWIAASIAVLRDWRCKRSTAFSA